MRVYIPATFRTLKTLSETDEIVVDNGWGFAVTPALEEFYTSGDSEEIEFVAFDEAARVSLKLLQAETEYFPHRRVVIAVEIPENQVKARPDMGDAVVRVEPPVIRYDQVVSLHVDVAGSEETTKRAVELIDEADLGDEDAELAVGDALDQLLAWYDPTELGLLVALL